MQVAADLPELTQDFKGLEVDVQFFLQVIC